MNDLLYRCTNNDGFVVNFQHRNEALKYYEMHQSIRLESYTKELMPKINIILSESGYDVNNLRNDDTLNKTSVALRKAVKKYDEKATKGVYLKLNKETDKDIIEALENVENKQGLIKDLLREYLQKELH